MGTMVYILLNMKVLSFDYDGQNSLDWDSVSSTYYASPFSVPLHLL